MKIHTDTNACAGHRVCVGIRPGIFEIGNVAAAAALRPWRWGGIALLLLLIPAGAAAQMAASTRPPTPPVSVAGASQQPDTAGHDRNSAETSRMRQYVRDVTGPWALLGTSVGAGVDHLRDAPQEWDQNHGGYGRRLASLGGRFAIQTTVTHGLGAAMDRPTSYPRCECTGRARRVRHALLGTITDLRPEGGRTLALPRIAGVYAGAFAQLAWHPGNADAGDALKSGTAFIVASTIQNLVREFLGAGIPILAH